MLTNAVPAQIEAVLLELFWFYVNQGTDRLELLKLFAAQPVTRSTEWNRVTVREEATRAVTRAAEQCFSCLTGDRRLYWHHVIPVDRGGSNQHRNRVPICLRCHSVIHPWLPANRKGEQRGGEWWSLSDVVAEAERRETALGDVSETAKRTDVESTT